jgi:RNA polymerase sigma-70 factor (ECF subfamily)
LSDTVTQDRFQALQEEHRKIVHKVASSYCRDRADRDDLAQEIIAQLWRSFPRYDERYRFSTWMYRVALNVAISAYRSETVRTRHLVPAGDSVLEVAAPADQPDERLQRLHELIQELNEVDRALVILYLDGHRHDAIAEVLGMSESNVGTRMGRIKQRLRSGFAHTA